MRSTCDSNCRNTFRCQETITSARFELTERPPANRTPSAPADSAPHEESTALRVRRAPATHAPTFAFGLATVPDRPRLQSSPGTSDLPVPNALKASPQLRAPSRSGQSATTIQKDYRHSQIFHPVSGRRPRPPLQCTLERSHPWSTSLI